MLHKVVKDCVLSPYDSGRIPGKSMAGKSGEEMGGRPWRRTNIHRLAMYLVVGRSSLSSMKHEE